MARKKYIGSLIIFIFLTSFVGCTSYERQIVPFKMPQESPNAVKVDGAVIASRSFISVEEAREAFGFDIRSAGILPVQVAFDNKSNHSLMIVAEQTFLIDEQSNVWPILDSNLAYDRLSKVTEMGKVIPEGAKKGLLFGAAGAVIGAAIGIVTGTNIGTAAGKGAAIGAAAGIVTGGAQAVVEHQGDVKRKINEDLQKRSLQYRPVKPGELAYGFIFYPGEAKTAKVLRLQLRETDTGKISTFNMNLQ